MSDLVEKLREHSGIFEPIAIMAKWDHIAGLLRKGSHGSHPRDIFESIIDQVHEDTAAAADAIEAKDAALISLEADKRMVDDLLTAAVADYNGVLAKLQEIADLTKRQQLPITAQIYEIATSALHPPEADHGDGR